MVRFFKLPLKFKQVIYLMNKVNRALFILGVGWGERVLITSFCTVYCLAYLNASRHLDQCLWRFCCVPRSCTVVKP